MNANEAREGLQCESTLHRNTDKTTFVLVPVYLRMGAASRWVMQQWCQRCLEEERVRRG